MLLDFLFYPQSMAGDAHCARGTYNVGPYHLNNVDLQFANDLGVQVTCNFSWNDHALAYDM